MSLNNPSRDKQNMMHQWEQTYEEDEQSAASNNTAAATSAS